MKKIKALGLCAAGFLLIAAPIYMKTATHPFTVNGRSFGNAVVVGGVLAISVQDFANGIAGTPNLQQAGIIVVAHTVTVSPQLQASAAADTFTLVNGSGGGKNATGGGGGAGKVRFNDIHVTKRTDVSSAAIVQGTTTYIPVKDVFKAFGVNSAPPANLPEGAPITLNVTHNATAAVTVGGN